MPYLYAMAGQFRGRVAPSQANLFFTCSPRTDYRKASQPLTIQRMGG